MPERLEESGVHHANDATPLGDRTTTPWLQTRPRAQTWSIAALALNGGTRTPSAELSGSAEAPFVTVSWPDGATTVAQLPHSTSA